MFKALIGIIIFALAVVVIFVVATLTLESIRSKKTPASNSIDEIIKDLEIKIELAELQASRGVETAEQNLQKYKSDLEKARSIKNKLNN